MHELALSQSIVDQVLERAGQERLWSVTRIVLQVGAGAGVEAEALRFCFDAVTRDTAAQGAELSIEVVALAAKCRECGWAFEPEALLAPCPRCGAFAPEITAGRELRVLEFEGATDGEERP
jgi:hydrogenase nickel incorporation protein HypA/HybF